MYYSSDLTLVLLLDDTEQSVRNEFQHE